jgi:DNA repair protein RecO (recombination protein O)
MDERSHGVILRTRLLTETSLIVHWLTPELGRVATVAKGARRPKSPFRGKLDLFYEADFSFARSRRSELHNLREVVLIDSHAGLRQNLGWLQQASYCTAFIEQTTETETPLPEVHALLTSVLAHLAERPPNPRTLFAFEFKMLALLGQQPDLTDGRLTPGTMAIARVLSTADWETIGHLKLGEDQSTQLRTFLHGFLIYHLGKLPRGRAAALGT